MAYNGVTKPQQKNPNNLYLQEERDVLLEEEIGLSSCEHQEKRTW